MTVQDPVLLQRTMEALCRSGGVPLPCVIHAGSLDEEPQHPAARLSSLAGGIEFPWRGRQLRLKVLMVTESSHGESAAGTSQHTI